MRLIFNSIRFLLRLVWRVLWGLVWSFALSFLIIVGIFYFTTSTESGSAGLSQAVQTAVVRVGQFLDHQGIATGLHTNVETQTDQLTDEHTTTGARWDQAEAAIYIDTDNETFRSAYQDAIGSWNQTGAFTFHIVTDKDKADIIATEMNDGSVSAAGEAESQTNLLTNRFTNVTVRLNGYYLLNNRYGYSYERIVNTAEHELGHAIGLDHNEEDSVMQSAGSFYSIQPADIQAVKDLYQT
ncbi:matrixin family metalloprotease [Streptococcus panodentis]|uniref:Peptidase n=1 Tax=Streptococcus panodentis TaxID=1581472 RepID=A0ABS5AU79_9STRE|nr:MULTISPECIES: matrixin family metalloprotease [Streptococcus]KXT83012.1 putative Zn-dependent protease [Streptococcus sp. DD11]MBP2620124.1 peptidase [Streptococcus panodentis]